MSGALIHAPSFEPNWYTGNDGQRHYEMAPVGGNIVPISYSSWHDVVEYFASLGVPRELWPVYETDVDLPLSQVVAQNETLREHVCAMPLGAERPTWAEQVARIVCSGEVFFYCIQ